MIYILFLTAYDKILFKMGDEHRRSEHGAENNSFTIYTTLPCKFSPGCTLIYPEMVLDWDFQRNCSFVFWFCHTGVCWDYLTQHFYIMPPTNKQIGIAGYYMIPLSVYDLQLLQTAADLYYLILSLTVVTPPPAVTTSLHYCCLLSRKLLNLHPLF